MSDFASKHEVDGRSEAEVFPNVDSGFEPKGNRVLVQLRKPKSTSKGGILLVQETRATEKYNDTIAKVVSMGSLAYKDPNTMVEWPEGKWCKEGDIVRVIKYGGDRWAVPHEDSEVVFIVLQDKEIIGALRDFEVARTMFPAFVA